MRDPTFPLREFLPLQQRDPSMPRPHKSEPPSLLPKFLRIHRNSIRHWLILVGLLTQRFWPVPFALGTALVVAGAAFRLWTKGYLTQRQELTTTGPYALCRNPFYLGNLVLDVGICLLIGRVEVAVPYLALWAFFHYRKILKEERELEVAYGDAYVAYKQSVPRLAPRRLRPRGGTVGDDVGFSWLNKNLAKKIELPRFLSALSLPFLFFAWHHLRLDGVRFFAQEHPLHFCALGAFLWLQLLSRALRKPVKRGEPLLPAWLHSRRAGVLCAVVFLGLALLATPRDVLASDLWVPASIIALQLVLALAVLPPLRVSDGSGLALDLLACGVVSVAAGIPWAFFLPLSFYSVLLGERLLVAVHHERIAAVLRERGC